MAEMKFSLCTYALWLIAFTGGPLLHDTNVVLADHWGYPPAAPNGEVLVDENWGGQCDVGKQQSPIDLSFAASVRGYFPEFNFADYEHVIPNANVTNNGHSVQINVGAPDHIVLSGGGLEQEYVFDQMHFHWGSEHTLNGRRYALELHMVHHDRRYSLREALQVKNGIAVLGVLFHVSASANDKLQNILNSVDDIANVVGSSAAIKEALLAGDLLPRNRDSYFRYEGSLTTPSCLEAVVWTVFTQSMPLSYSQLEALKLVKSSDGTELIHNYRQVQPLNRRSLIYATHEDTEQSLEYMAGGAPGDAYLSLSSWFHVIGAFVLRRILAKVL